MRIWLFATVALFFSFPSAGQDNRIYGSAGLGATATGAGHVPFWFSANQSGSVPLPGVSAGGYATMYKYYDSIGNPTVDWGMGVNVRGDAGSSGTRGEIIEGYLKAALSVVEIRGGRWRQIVGLADSTLSSGSFSQSGNAPGIPQLQLSLPNFYQLPLFGDLFGVKASFAMGWPGSYIPPDMRSAGLVRRLYHSKAAYVRIGQPAARVHVTAGINEQVLYGGERTLFGSWYKRTPSQTTSDMIFLKKFGGQHFGNIVGSIDLGAEFENDSVRIFVYRQNFFDQQALFEGKNLSDGLNGIAVTNKSRAGRKWMWRKIVFEVISGLDQGHLHLPAENYYNDAHYTLGWSYQQTGIGNPLLSQSENLRYLPYNTTDRFVNNRVVAAHIAASGTVNDIQVTTKLTFSRNYGTYSSDQNNEAHDPSVPALRTGINQFSAYFSAVKPLTENLLLTAAAAFDYGNLLYHSSGLTVTLSRSF